jgi:hypothetical protein
MSEFLEDIPTYDAKTATWSTTSFSSRADFVAFLWSIWKEPGKYEFDETSLIFNEESRKFRKEGIYCRAPVRTKDYVDYWDDQKQKCRKGVIFYGTKGQTWFLNRDYYMWLNFLPIYNKEVARFTFADVRDAQYHMSLYEAIAEWSYRHGAILKKRQIASSYYHAGKMINLFWFEEGAMNKMAGSLKDYVNEKGTWRFLEEYRNFLNEHTAWYRPCNPDKVLNWEQKVEVNTGGRKTDRGLKSVLIGLSLDKDPTNGVGGPCRFFFHEEAGIAPKMNETIEYLLPALKSGMIYTGMFIAAGSVGDLEQCEPLKEMIFNPDAKDVLKVETNLVDSKGTIKECGLFIPEQWSMLPCIDKYGNSLVEEALKMIMEERAQWKKDMKPDDYQLRISQKPTNIEEAFAYRKESKFPQHLVTQQIRRIEEKEYFYEHLKLERNEKGKIDAKETRKLPISEFPLSTTAVDKEGCLVVWERPVKDAPWGTYYASMDPVRDGKTTTSKSLCSLIIYKNPLEVTTHKMDGTVEHVIEQDKIVASWCGRFDDINDTHRFCEQIIEWYNAWTLCENNVTGFIQYMIGQRKQKYLVPKNQIAFLKDLGSNTNVFQDYGWRNVGTIFKTNLIEYGIQFLNEKIDESVDPEGNILSIRYGVERIPDIMILKEMQAYREGVNVDRLVSYCALVAFAKVQQANRGVARKTEHENEESKQMSNNMSKLNMTPFRNMGRQRTVVDDKYKVSRSPYKNYK